MSRGIQGAGSDGRKEANLIGYFVDAEKRRASAERASLQARVRIGDVEPFVDVILVTLKRSKRRTLASWSFEGFPPDI